MIMFDEIVRLVKYLNESDEGRTKRKKIIFTLAGIVSLLIINRFLLIFKANLDYFYHHTALSRLLFISNISPYDLNIQSILDNFFSSRSIEVSLENFQYNDPLFQLFFFLPFTLITDHAWAAAIFLTVNQACIFLIVEQVYQLLKWRPAWKTRLLHLGLAFFSVFSLSFFSSPDLSIIQVLLFLLGLNLSLKNKFIAGGVVLSFTLFDFPMMNLPMLLLLMFLFILKKSDVIVWFFISLGLLSLAGLIFDNNWPLKMIRNIFLEPIYYPFIPYSQAVGIDHAGAFISSIINLFPIVLFILLIMEWIRIPKENPYQLFWMLSLIFTLNPFLVNTKKFQLSFIAIFVYLYIFYLWDCRSSGSVKKAVYGFFSVFIVLLPCLGYAFPSRMGFLYNTRGYNLIAILLTLLMLYWVRWWILQMPSEDEA